MNANIDVNLTCDELRALVGDHLDGDLPGEKQDSFALHIQTCENCGYYVESYTHTVKVVKKLPRCGLPPATEAKLRAALYEHFGLGGG